MHTGYTDMNVKNRGVMPTIREDTHKEDTHKEDTHEKKDHILVCQDLKDAIKKYDRLFELTWNAGLDHNDYIHEWEEQGELIVAMVREKMGLPDNLPIK